MSANPPKVAGDDRNGNSMASPLFLGLGCICCGDYTSRIELMDPDLVDDQVKQHLCDALASDTRTAVFMRRCVFQATENGRALSRPPSLPTPVWA